MSKKKLRSYLIAAKLDRGEYGNKEWYQIGVIYSLRRPKVSMILINDKEKRELAKQWKIDEE